MVEIGPASYQSSSVLQAPFAYRMYPFSVLAKQSFADVCSARRKISWRTRTLAARTSESRGKVKVMTIWNFK